MTVTSQTLHEGILQTLFGQVSAIDKNALRLELVKAQYDLRATRTQGQATGLLVLVNGIELSGKGSSVAQLRDWMDPRLLNVEATLGESPSRLEPIWQSHTAKLPRHGNITVYFGNWYADLIVGALTQLDAARHDLGDASNSQNSHIDGIWQGYIDQEIERLNAFEADLSNNHTKILKCWFDIDEATLQKRLNDADPDPHWLYQIDWCQASAVKDYRQVANYILNKQNNWQRFDGSATKAFTDHSHNQQFRDKSVDETTNDKGNDSKDSLAFIDRVETKFALHVLTATRQALSLSDCEDSTTAENYRKGKRNTNAGAAFSWADVPDKLTDIDDPDMDKSDYKNRLAEKQATLARLLRDRKLMGDGVDKAGHVVFAFEGMDAAGKGGAIRRLVAPLDPREYQIYNIAAPTTIELQHPYLWRFWTRLPQYEPSLKEERLSRIAIFDRTWYGRVLVERIEGFASKAAWQRAYDEINRMEADLHAHGTLVIKYWLAIDKKEQLERFEDRQDTPHKQFKLTDDDWRNRDKWHDYVQAAADMLARTNTRYAPWHVVATNDKRTARLAVLDHAIKQLKKNQ